MNLFLSESLDENGGRSAIDCVASCMTTYEGVTCSGSDCLGGCKGQACYNNCVGGCYDVSCKSSCYSWFKGY